MRDDAPIPLLREDGASLDWSAATYQVQITVEGSGADAHHMLSGAPQLDALIAAGDVQYALELRCPKTLYACVAYSSDAKIRCEWNPGDVDGEMFLVPGLVSVRPCRLDAGGLSELWGSEPIDVAAGRWLARGSILRTQSLASSLLEFHRKSELTDGEMQVEPDTGSGDLRFKVYLAPNHFDKRVRERDVQVAALIGVMGRIPHLDSGDGGGYAILSLVKAALAEKGVPAWEGELNAEFDPARAATAIEKFHIPIDGGDE